MSHPYTYPIAWLLVLLLSSNAHCFTTSDEIVPPAATKVKTAEDAKHGPPVNTGTSVINIIVDRIDNNRIYARDGRSFPITDSTNFVNNHNPKAKVQTAELFFQNGNLVAITIK